MSGAASRAGLVVAEADLAISTRLEASLAVLGVALERVVAGGDRSPGAVVVVQGPAASADDSWQALVASLGSARPIPVVVESVADAEVPEALRTLNWIRWPAADDGGEETAVTAASASTAVFTALNSDFDRLQLHRDLEAETQAWVDAGRDDSLLIDNRRRARRAAEHLDEGGEDILTRPSAEMGQFVACSLAATQRAMRKRRWRWIRRGAAMALVAVLFAGVLIDRKAHVANTHLAGLVYGAAQFDGRPDRGAMVAAAAIVQGRPAGYEAATNTLRESLSQPWSSGILGVEQTAGLLDAVPVRDGDTVLSVDAGGRVASWDSETDAAIWQRETGLTGQPKIAASEDGQEIAVVSDRRLVVAQVSPWRTSRYAMPAGATEIAIDPLRSRFVVASSRRLLSVSASGGGRAEPAPGAGEMLDLVTGEDGRSLALREPSPGHLEVVDAVSGQRIFVLPKAPGPVEMGTVGPGGSVVVNIDDRLFAAGGNGRWRSLGRKGSAAGVLRLLPGEILASGGWATPLAMTDLATGIDLGPICDGLVAVSSLRPTPSGELLACTNGWVTELWPTVDQRPLPKAGPNHGLRGSRVLRIPGMVFLGGSDGVLRVSVEPGRGYGRRFFVMRVGRGAVEAVALNTDAGYSIVAGTSRGDLAEFDLRNSGLTKTMAWQAPDGSAIEEVGWARRPGRLMVGTASGHWWQPRSCDACQDVRVVLARARERFWGCYASDALAFMDGAAERVLGLSACTLPPEPE